MVQPSKAATGCEVTRQRRCYCEGSGQDPPPVWGTRCETRCLTPTSSCEAKVEVAVLVVERWILARLRNRRFFSLAAMLFR
jgi:hypothetical protein